MSPDFILRKRQALDLTRKEFSDWLGLDHEGQKLLKHWESGELKVPQSFVEKILALPETAPFAQSEKGNYKFRFIDLFAGIGGIRLPFQRQKGRCVFSSEWDKFAQKTYRINFGDSPHGDITKINAREIPDHDILVGGFPCQPFSQAGLKKGFSDPRGTLFFDIQKILVEKRPKAFLLENVKQLKGHNKGETLQSILSILEGRNTISKAELASMNLSKDALKALSTKLNYYVTFKVLNANKFGVPQNRERIYLIGFDKDSAPRGFDFSKNFRFPEPKDIEVQVGQILEDNKQVNEKYTLSEKLWSGHVRRKEEHKNKGNGFGYCLFNKNSNYTNTISARYYKDGSEVLIDQADINKRPRKLTPRECARLQGFPEEYQIPVSDAQAYKQFGNSVAMPVIEDIAKQMLITLNKAKMLK